MLGAIIGDMVGSVYENENIKSTDFVLFGPYSHFTDDTVLTIAVADAVLCRRFHPHPWIDAFLARRLYATKLKQYARLYPQAGYGASFEKWFKSETRRGYGSYGNGSAMRVSPIGFAYGQLKTVLREASLSAVVTHNHRQGIKGAQAVASAVFLAKSGESKAGIQHFIERRFKYNLHQRLDDIRPGYRFDSSCQGSVPQAIIAFLESDDFEDAIRKAVSIGGDSDTIACIAGGIAHAYYQSIPASLASRAKLLLDGSFKPVFNEFNARFGKNYS